MQRSKLMFSDAELQMACNTEVILTKNRIIEKVFQAFGGLGRNLFEELAPLRTALPEETGILPKISKGEQYRGLPWVMLDYPRCFHQKKGHLALRVMFWWGNYYLVQMHVSGNYLAPVLKKSEEWVKRGTFSETGWWIGFPENSWDFLIPQPGMCNPEEFNWLESFTKSGIFKIIKVLPIENQVLDETVMKLALLMQEALSENV
jgi:hypothetical protein